MMVKRLRGRGDCGGGGGCLNGGGVNESKGVFEWVFVVG